jgi:SAM-dependent methyltransferase
MTSAPEEMAAEFGTVAGWTEEAVEALGPDYAVPAGCRGSGSPAALRWLADALQLRSGVAFLDDGAGVGGPAGWLVQDRAVRAVCAEPSAEATGACLRLFGLPVVQAESEALPFAAASFDAAWSLGVLCTLDDKAAALAELRRVLRPAGRLGLLVFAAEGALTGPQPEGNSFPLRSDLPRLLAEAGFDVVAQLPARELPEPDEDWAQRAAAVEEQMASRHGGSRPWQQAAEQQEKVGGLLERRELTAVLLHAVCRG